ncbi:MAG: hypothetical protein ACPGU7_12985 [Gammaproteobacteria bacterium]
MAATALMIGGGWASIGFDEMIDLDFAEFLKFSNHEGGPGMVRNVGPRAGTRDMFVIGRVDQNIKQRQVIWSKYTDDPNVQTHRGHLLAQGQPSFPKPIAIVVKGRLQDFTKIIGELGVSSIHGNAETLPRFLVHFSAQLNKPG